MYMFSHIQKVFGQTCKSAFIRPGAARVVSNGATILYMAWLIVPPCSGPALVAEDCLYHQMLLNILLHKYIHTYILIIRRIRTDHRIASPRLARVSWPSLPYQTVEKLVSS